MQKHRLYLNYGAIRQLGIAGKRRQEVEEAEKKEEEEGETRMHAQ